MESSIKFRGVTSSTHKKVLIAIVALCVVFSLTSSHTVARSAHNPLVKLAILVGVMMMTYISPILGGILAACFVYCISAAGFLEGYEGGAEDVGAEGGVDGEEEDEEEDGGGGD
jgi:hypothetical protein